MSVKSAEQKIIEKQMKAQDKTAREEKLRDRASGLVGAAHMVEGFRIMDSESEALLDEILKQYDGNERNYVCFERHLLPRNLQEACPVLYEALIMYGMLSSVIAYGKGAMITLSDSGKNYFANKGVAEKRTEEKVIDVAQKKRSSRCVYSDNAGIIFYNMYIAFSGKYVSMAGGGEFYEIRKLVCNAKRWRAIQYLER